MGVFRPYPLATVNIVAATSSARVALPAWDHAEGAVYVSNSGSVPVYIEFGTSSVSASTTASMQVLPGEHRVIQSSNAPYVAAITGSSTAAIYFTAGVGDN